MKVQVVTGFVAFVFVTFFAAVALAEVSLVSVVAQQRQPWNGVVDIEVTMKVAAEELKDAQLVFAATNGATKKALSIGHITQNGADVGSETTWTRKFIWDAKTDVGAVKIDDVVLTINVVLPYVQLWENGPYWAKCNVGATKPEEYGYYFWWGDTVGYVYNGSGWNAVDGSSTNFRFYNWFNENSVIATVWKDNDALQSDGWIDSSGNVTAAHDAATAHLGAPWRMPTDAEFAALLNNCDTTWTTRNGVYGRLVTGRGAYASKSIFLPAAGEGDDFILDEVGSRGYYWSSSPYLNNGVGAWDFRFRSSRIYMDEDDRYSGHSVRPVRGFTGAGGDASGGTGSASTRLSLGGVIDGLEVDLTWRIIGQVGDCPETITLPMPTTGIASKAFSGCISLKSITIPSNVTEIGKDAFKGCVNLTTIHVDAGDIERVRKLVKASGLDVARLSFIDANGAVFEPITGLPSHYGPFVPGKEIEPIDFSFAVGWKITGLPTGLKFDTKTSKIIGKPTKSGEFKVTLTRTSDKTVATTTFEVMSAAEDKAAIEITIAGDMKPQEMVDGFDALTLPVGVFVNWPIEATALSATTVKVAGLPSGLKLVQDKVTKAYSIQGTPTAASKVDKKTGNIVPSLAKFTVTTAGKNSRVFTMPITTMPMSTWAVGTFNGGLISAEGKELGLVTLTTTAAGKISGKILKRGQTWAVSATGFDAYDADGYHATLTAKSGKLTPETYEIVISKEGVFGANADGEQIEAYWNPWKTPQGKARGKDLAAMYKPGLPTEGLELPEGMTSLTLKLSASGAINATGFFDGGYKATSSTVLVSTDSGYLVYLYFAPNAKKGFAAGEALTVRLDL